MQEKLKSLRTFNLIASILHFAQAIIIWIISDPNKGIIPITVNYLKFDQGTQRLLPASHQIAQINLAWLIIIFFLLSAFAHLFVATIYQRSYAKNLQGKINKVRWYEYALSASVMMLAIGMLSGIYDLSSLIMIFALDALMNLSGLAMEIYNNSHEETNWTSYILGSLAGIIPWIVFALYVFASFKYGGGNIPTFVYWIYVSIFIFFNSFAVNMLLQYKRIGPWKDYLYGEKVYIILSLVAKSLLAWQVFAGTLRP